VPTIDKGKTKVKCHRTQSAGAFALHQRHAGAPLRQTGDMYVQVVVERHRNRPRSTELLAESKIVVWPTQPEAAVSFTKVKDFFGTRAAPSAISKLDRTGCYLYSL